MTKLTTQVVPNTWNKKPMFTVYEIEHVEIAKASKKKVGDIFKPIINIGMTKAKAICDHSKELAEFVGVE